MQIDLKQKVTAINNAFSEGNLEAFLNLCNDDIHWKIVGDREAHGKDEIRKLMEEMNMGPVPMLELLSMTRENNTVVCEGILEMKNELQQNSKIQTVDIYKFQNEKVSELRSYVIEVKG